MTLMLGDCLDVMRGMEPNSVDSIVTDPPYGLSFMGKDWDSQVPGPEYWKEVLRVLKPGGHLLAFAGTRTQHRMAVAIEDAGFEIRDMIAWVYGSGFPKSQNVSKAIDKAAGAERDVVGHDPSRYRRDNDGNNTYAAHCGQTGDITAPATPEAQQWDGWGTALKPSHEPVGVYYKALTVKNLLGILLGSVTEEIWVPICQRSNVSVNDAEKILACIRHNLEGAAAFSVAASAKISALENIESAIVAAQSSTSQKHTQAEKDTTRGDFAHGVASQNGNEQPTKESTTRRGQADVTNMVGTFICAMTENTGQNIALLWSNILDAALNQANTFTTATALKLTTELKTLKCLVQASTSQNTGSSSSFRPALEPITVARKPLAKGNTVAANVLEHGTGAINVDGCRVSTDDNLNGGAYSGGDKRAKDATSYAMGVNAGEFVQPQGRWPANLIHDGSDEVTGRFPVTGAAKASMRGEKTSAGTHSGWAKESHKGFDSVRGHNDNGGSAARFFYCAKASKKDRGEGSKHPTVKPTDLMRYLCRLVTPPGGVVLDPFMGSGSTGKAAVAEGFRFIGIERDEESFNTATARVKAAEAEAMINRMKQRTAKQP